MNRFLTHPTHYSASFNRDIQIDASKPKTSYHKERRFSRFVWLNLPTQTKSSPHQRSALNIKCWIYIFNLMLTCVRSVIFPSFKYLLNVSLVWRMSITFKWNVYSWFQVQFSDGKKEILYKSTANNLIENVKFNSSFSYFSISLGYSQ